MAYNPTVYVNDNPPALNADNLNKAENGIAGAVNTLISENNQGELLLSLYSGFELGTLLNGNNHGANYRIRSVDIIVADRDWNLTIASGYRAAFHYFVSGSYTEQSGWKTGTFTIPKDTNFRVTIGKTPEDTSITANINEFASKVTFDSYLSEQINDLDNKVNYFEATIDGLYIDGKQRFSSALFSRGLMNVDGTINTGIRYRAVNFDLIDITRDTIIEVNEPFRIDIYKYNSSGTFVERTGWVYTNTSIAEGTKIRIQISKTPEDTSVLADVEEFVASVSLGTFVSEQIGKLQIESDNINYTLDGVLADGKQFLSPSLFSRGLMNVDGTINTGIRYRAVNFDLIEAKRNTTIIINKSGFRIDVYKYNSSGTFVERTGWVTTRTTVPKGMKMRIQISKTPEDTSVLADVEEFVGAIYFGTCISELVDDSISSGNLEYLGDKIHITEGSETRRCTINTYLDLKDGDIPDLASYNLHLNQSMTIYGGYIFLFSHGGDYTIMDYSTKEIVDSGLTPVRQSNHANSAQFTNIFYDANDEFPLMMLSRCGAAASGSGNEECLIYRVTRSGTSFTFTLINSIFAPFTTFAASWGVDNNTQFMYLACYLNDYWTTVENNPLYFFAFKMPSREAILSGNNITLTIADMLCKMEYIHVILQGMCVNGGLIYIGITQSGQNIYVVDVWSNRVRSRIKLVSAKEVEGVAIYNNKLYCTQKDGGDSAAVNPFQMFELIF